MSEGPPPGRPVPAAPVAPPPVAALAGRATEMERLRQALSAATHAVELVLVSGASGVGKSALAAALAAQARADGGHAARGKFDQFLSTSSFAAPLQAMAELCGSLLTEPESRLGQSKQRLATAIGANVGLLAGLVPPLQVLLDLPRPVGEAADGGLRQTDRLTVALSGAFRAMATPAEPMLLVLDDMQWADAATFGLLRELALDDTTRGLCIVLTGRTTRLEQSQPLLDWFDDMKAAGANCCHLPLEPLSPDGVAELVASRIGAHVSDLPRAVRQIHLAAGGNPLHVIEATRALYGEKVEATSSPSDGATSGGRLSKTLALAYATDMQSLLGARIARLGAAERQLLTIAACLGATVDSKLLATVSSRGEKPVMSAVGRLVDAGLLEIVSSGTGLAIRDGRLDLRIAHDQVQAAVRASTSDEAWKRMHLRISAVLADSGTQHMRAGIHLSEAIDLLQRPAERAAGLRRLLVAAKDAHRSAAFEIALQLLALARSLRGDDAWKRRFGETFELEVAWHRALFYLARHEECDAVYHLLILRARDSFDLIEPTVIQMSILQSRSQMAETISLGMDLLRRVAPELPFETLGTDLSAAWSRFLAMANARPLESLIDAPPADTRTAALSSLLFRISEIAIGDPSLVAPWCNLVAIDLWIGKGFHETMLMSGLQLGFHAAMQGDHATVQRLAVFSMRVAQARASDEMRGFVEGSCCLGVYCWYRPLEESVEIGETSFERFKQAGNVEMASYMRCLNSATAIELSPTLQQAEQAIAASLQFAQRANQHVATSSIASLLGFTGRMRGRSGTMEAVVTGYPLHDVYTFGYLALSSLLLGESVPLARHAETLRSVLAPTGGFYVGALAAFVTCWSAIDRLSADESLSAQETATLDAGMTFLQGSAERAPANFGVMHALLRARRVAATGRTLQALPLFDAAVRAGAAGSRPWQQALAVEHAGRFCLSAGLTALGERLLQEAHQRYLLWGATRKAEQLVEAFVFLSTATMTDGPMPPPRPAIDTQDRDRAALHRASQALSSETDLARLVDRILAIVTRLTGATGASLLKRSESGEWTPVGRTHPREHLPDTLVRYASRTLQSEAIVDLATDVRFADDPGTGRGPRAVLIMPINDKGLPHAILLLENSNAADFFTSAHIETVQLITGQLSTSLQNADLYRTLELRVTQRTEELQRVATALALRERALESSSNGVHISELTSGGEVVVYVNAMFERITGYGAADLTGSPIWALLGAEPDQAGVREMRDAVEARRSASATLRCYRRDGTMFWSELSISPFQSAQGAVYFVGVHMDVSERVRAAEEDKRRTDRLRAVFELSPDGFVVLDASATITVVNPAFSRMTGLDAHDLLGRSLTDFERALEAVSVPSGELVDRGAFANVLSGEPQKDIEAGMGEHGWLLTIAEPRPRTLVRRLRRALSGPETVIYFRDVTRELEVDRMKSEFLSVAAHELRTPMTSIYGFSELLITGRLPQDQQAGVHRIIHKQSSALIGLVGQLLDLARINAMQGAKFVLRPTSLQSVARDVMGALRGIESSERIVDALPADDVMAMVDADQLHLAVTNVLSNALKYSSAGPVRVDIARRKTPNGRSRAGLRVSDKGIGMSPDQLSRLFERFYRVNPTAGTSGTGLGATIVRDIMTAHKGEVEVTSELGVGTTVTLWVDLIAP